MLKNVEFFQRTYANEMSPIERKELMIERNKETNDKENERNQ